MHSNKVVMSHHKMTTAHEPINYLDNILNEEEQRCEYSHQWRNFTISRSGRFKTKNKLRKRDVVDAKLFDVIITKEEDTERIAARSDSSRTNSSMPAAAVRDHRDKEETYKSFYETNF